MISKKTLRVVVNIQNLTFTPTVTATSSVYEMTTDIAKARRKSTSETSANGCSLQAHLK